MFKKRHINPLLLACVFVMSSLFAQGQVNLILEGGFEDPISCPTSIAQVYLSSWRRPNNHLGSSDLYNVCGVSGTGIPSNMVCDNCPALQGEGYAGGYAVYYGNTYREYLMDTLASPLTAFKRYRVSFYYLLADKSTRATDDLGADFSVSHPEAILTQPTGWLGYEPTTRNPEGNYLSNMLSWRLYTQVFEAEGGEQYITIGMFDSLASYITLGSSSPGFGYYLYDSISVIYDYGLGVNNHCFGETVQFDIDTIGLTTAAWNFDDPGSGTTNISTLFEPTHQFSDTGLFNVSVILDYDSLLDTVTSQIHVFPRQTLELGSDTTLCEPANILLDIGQSYSTYLWSDGSTADTFLINTDSTVFVTLSGVCDTLTDTITISVDSDVTFDLGPDSTLCSVQTLLLDAEINEDGVFEWSNGDTLTDSIVVSHSGVYSLTFTNSCGSFSDTVELEFLPSADSLLLPPDTINCFDSPIILTVPNADSFTYVWSDSTTKNTFEVDSTMTVWLAAFNECGITVDTMNLIFNPEIQTELGEDTTICIEDSVQLWGADSLATYLWNTGDTTDTIWTISGETKNYIVTIRLGHCEQVESRRVLVTDVFCPNINCQLEYGNVFSPNGDGLNDRFQIWSDCDLYSFEMYIYNRWGQLVNYTSNISYGWDGYINGTPATNGVYYFVVESKDLVVVDADRRVTRGSFHLVR